MEWYYPSQVGVTVTVMAMATAMVLCTEADGALVVETGVAFTAAGTG